MENRNETENNSDHSPLLGRGVRGEVSGKNNSPQLSDELKQLSPLLAERKKVNPFSVPENYFSSMEESVMEKITADSVKRELQNTILNELPKQEVFDVPYGYFERLPEQILQKTSRRKSMNVWDAVNAYYRNSFRPAHFIAASPMLAVLILAIVILMKPADVIQTSPSVAQMSNEEISNYLTADVSSLDENEIIARLDDETINNLSSGMDLKISDDDALLDVQQIDLSDIQNL